MRSGLLLMMMFLFIGSTVLPRNAAAQTDGGGRLNTAFAQAAQEFGVPRDLLVTVAYAETHFDDHNGEPSMDNGYGMLHLVQNNQADTLNVAASILGVSTDVIKVDSVQNIRGGAAVLRRYADEQGLNEAARSDMAQWYQVLGRYSNATSTLVQQMYADEAYKLLNAGFSGAADGETISVSPQQITPNKPVQSIAPLSLEQPFTNGFADDGRTNVTTAIPWAAAHPNNYAAASRPTSSPIRYVIIHTTQGSYTSALNWFQNPAAGVSAHYTIRSSDGQITQSVSERNIAYHAGNWIYNTQSVGIEHEGYVSNASWYTDAMYRSSAALTRSICQRYGIPMTRARIIGHNEVPGADHTDPGPYWNWNYYMQLVTGSSWSTTIDNATAGRFSASSSWTTSTYWASRFGADYRHTTPKLVSDAAWFKANLPTTANYEVYVWYPSSSGYNTATPFVIKTTSGNRTVKINQQQRGGQWVSLGVFNLAAGDYNAVGVSRYTSTPGYVVADAVRFVRR
jgi:N-acetyl-anhydromuramyl-L-alanine amidase AmpD